MTLLTVKNRNGRFVEYTKELSEDLKSMHGLDAATILRMMNGTEFVIRKKILDAKTMEFTLETNDNRDKPYVWTTQIVYHLH